ncbi:hypothetical protein [Spirilliplanes yamanashiensis]|uniref:Uncharacterized protein n=1 Tax=Spirilliplanes yamanashiensis TaxID=42233 RepID=A0A8J3Y990_9ACTN|nr:hypothetical protein [Spirilliplanes yamanashiensis]MDP9815488.1 hypothetical protein [Spirilliplanes yamanashiensis]GIJ03742.1 hypothetical protein Sya03_30940 [Spirilliplanes yamanashiensis]
MIADAAADERPVTVLRDSVETSWPIRVIEGRYPELTLTLTGDGRTWNAVGTSVFAALMDLREQLEAERIQLCCNGARRNAWSSGMQQDMGRGHSVYLLEENQSGEPTEVRTLDPAPGDQVVTVLEQRTWYADWLAQRTGGRRK